MEELSAEEQVAFEGMVDVENGGRMRERERKEKEKGGKRSTPTLRSAVQ